MGAFFAELKRRHIYRVAAAYAVVAWGLLQLINNIAPGLSLPNWTVTLVIVLLAIGFPITLIFAWISQLPSADASIATMGRVDWFLAAALVAVIALVSYQELAPSRGAGAATQASTTVGSPSALSSASAGTALAVLPFANVSGDPGQEFFSDGMTDEIMMVLAKIPSLRVVGRQSVFQFKGKSEDSRSIGEKLGALYLVEGSVRKAGDRVRITAQLVRANDGVSLWTEGYDRDLKDIFATQEDVARAIATSLRVPLGLTPGETLVRDRTRDVESYDTFLRAKALLRSGGQADIVSAVNLLEHVVGRDADFAPGWALLGVAYTNKGVTGSPEERRQSRERDLNRAETAARAAIRLDPELATGYAALAGVQEVRGIRIASEDLFQQALALDPDDPDVLSIYCVRYLAAAGRLRQATNLCMKLHELDPLVSGNSIVTARIMQLNGQDREAIALLEPLPSSTQRNLRLARSYAAERRFAEAADTLLLINDGSELASKEVQDAANLLRRAPANAGNPNTLPDLAASLAFVYPYVGASSRVLDALARERQFNPTNLFDGVWLPVFAPLRNERAFKQYLREAGLVDFWRVRGWPDMCHPTTGDDFECN